MRALKTIPVVLRSLLAIASMGSASLRGAEPADAIVVGAGIAGLAAAWELAQGGAKVTVIDMASVFGGHAVMATGDLCLIGTPFQEARGLHDNRDVAYRDFIAWGEDADPAWVRYYVDHSRSEIFDWVSGMGVEFDALTSPAGNSVVRTHRTKGRGLGLISPIYRECVTHPAVTFLWNTRVDRLLSTEGSITGVTATHLRSGATSELRARVVVLATGGFQSNLDLVRANWPAGSRFPRNFLIGAGINAQGSGLQLAQRAGAALLRLDHQWNYVTGIPDPRFPNTPRGLNASNNYSMWVNTEGRRFIAERTSSKYSLPVMLEQPGETYWSIFDEAAKRELFVAGSNWSDFREVEKWIFANPALVKTAATLEELAVRTGLPATALQDSVRRFNAMAARGVDEDFGRFGPGKPIAPFQIVKPPFYAMQFFPLTRKSMGGVAIDLTARVQDAARRPIPGLFAAGELTGLAGINGKAGLEGTFLGPSIITGRVAGRSALTDLGLKPNASPPSPRQAQSKVTADPAATTALCLSCHDLPQLVAPPRAGFWHFEKVHQEVVARSFACTKCHADLSATYRPEAHRTNRLAQITTCVVCHQGEEH